jgi:lipid-A-disaccharide synthase
MRVMISCGEASGDLYAGALATALRVRQPDIHITGLGGPRLRAAGADLVGDLSAFAVTGVTSALRLVPRSLALIRRLKQDASVRRPDVLVVVDAPDFNFPLIRAFRSLRVPVVYYISPQLWAWRGGRMASIKRHAARVLVIFPFEEELYRQAGVPVQFVGHPLVELSTPTRSRDAFRSAVPGSPDAPIVALLPGSRHNEVRRIAPLMAAALPLIRARVPDARFVVAAAPALGDAEFQQLTASGATLLRGSTDDVLQGSDVAMTASGTATVQCALHERPMVVVYRMSGFDYRLVRPFVTVPHIAMPNLLAGARIVPELVQEEFTPAAAAEATVTLLTNADAHVRTVEALRAVRAQLGGAGASARAADAVLAVAGA